MKKAELLKNLSRRRRMFEEYLKEKMPDDRAARSKGCGLRNAGSSTRRSRAMHDFKNWNQC